MWTKKPKEMFTFFLVVIVVDIVVFYFDLCLEDRVSQIPDFLLKTDKIGSRVLEVTLKLKT